MITRLSFVGTYSFNPALRRPSVCLLSMRIAIRRAYPVREPSPSGKAGGSEVVRSAREILGTQEILPPRDELHRALDCEIGRDT